MKMVVKFLEKIFMALKKVIEFIDTERQAFVLCHRSTSGNKITLIASEIMVPNDEDYMSRSAGYCEVKKPFLNKVYNRAIEKQLDVIKVHSHPPGCHAIFSSIDEQHEPELMLHVHSQIDGMIQGSLVFNSTSDSLDGWYLDPIGLKLLPIEKVVVIGKNNLDILIPFRSPLSNIVLNPAMCRTAIAYGDGRVKRMGSLAVAIVGLGGTGSAIAELVARDQPFIVILCDDDKIEITNLNRLVGATEKDIGRYKAEFYAELIKSISPYTEVIALNKSFYDPEAQSVLAQADFIFGCVDSGVRLSVNQFSVSRLIPYFDLGASILSTDGTPEFIGGQVFSVIPGRNVCLSCSGVFDGLLHEYLSPRARQAEISQGYIEGDDGIISPLVAYLDYLVASLGYAEMLKYVLGLPGKQSFKLFIDQINDRLVRSECETGQCIVCRPEGYLGRGDKVPLLVPQEDLDHEKLATYLESSTIKE